MQMRHEVKHIISKGDAMLLQRRLAAVMQLDPHVGADGCYHIRSLYFDTPADRALREKLDGLSRREKYRIRIYDGRENLIRLEKKIKVGDLGTKISAPLTRQEVACIQRGEIDFLRNRPEEVLQQLYLAMRYEQLRPRTLVDYNRRPFIYAPGNVRVTLDGDIRTGLHVTDLFNRDAPTPPASQDTILEVKYDNFLPQVIRDVVQLDRVSTSAFSKYAACRQYI